MRATGTTMISRDSIVYPTMEGGSKGEIKEGSPRRSPGERRFLSQSSYSDVPAAAKASALSANPWPCTTLPFANLHTCQKVSHSIKLLYPSGPRQVPVRPGTVPAATLQSE